MWPQLHLHFIFSHLADAFIQSDLQLPQIREQIKLWEIIFIQKLSH